jgi:GNAT superfamily N-acetyltransferase
VSAVRFVRCDPGQPPASGLLAEMTAELNLVYETAHRLAVPAVAPADLEPPDGSYLVGYEGEAVVAGGGLRRLGPAADGLAEIKRMFVRPAARSRGVAAALLAALEAEAVALGYRRVRLDTGPRQQHALRLYRRAGYEELAAYNDNPFACYWAEKRLAAGPTGPM